MNILIVESKNDQYFVEALAKEVSSVDKVCNIQIDKYKYSCLDENKLTAKINESLTEMRSSRNFEKVSKMGVILDMDNSNQEERIQLINTCLKKSFVECDYPTPTNLLTDVNNFITNPLDEYLHVKTACFFTNIDGKGELETILKAIASQPSVFANCIYAGWKDCLERNGKTIGKSGEQCDIREKDLLKLWVDFYKRFDTLKKNDRDEENTDWEGIMLGIKDKEGNLKKAARGKDIFDLQSDKLKDIKSFLSMFD